MQEIERKYLLEPSILESPSIWPLVENIGRIKQAYLCTPRFHTSWEVRVRIQSTKRNFKSLEEAVQAYLTVKEGSGLARLESETLINLDEAEAIYRRTTDKITKLRYQIGRWEIDGFEGRHRGLVMAEIELSAEDELVLIPDWLEPYVIAEVTFDKEFKNSALAVSDNLPWYKYYTP